MRTARAFPPSMARRLPWDSIKTTGACRSARTEGVRGARRRGAGASVRQRYASSAHWGMCWLREGEAKLMPRGPTARMSNEAGASSNRGSGETTCVSAMEPERSVGRGAYS